MFKVGDKVGVRGRFYNIPNFGVITSIINEHQCLVDLNSGKKNLTFFFKILYQVKIATVTNCPKYLKQ